LQGFAQKHMEIFGKDSVAQQRLLDLYKSKELLFSPLRNSTLTAKGSFHNVEFNEKDCTSFDCNEHVLTVDSNYTHAKYELYDESIKKKSNRGRKKKVKKQKLRKIQGSGRCMNSQIQFGVIGQHIRRIPDFPDKHSKVDEEIVVVTSTDEPELSDEIPVEDADEIEDIDENEENEEIEDGVQKFTIKEIAQQVLPHLEIPEGHELVIKKYIFLVFRNGKFTLPGVLTEDVSDAVGPIENLCKFLSTEFWGEKDKVKLEYIRPTMRNYKFQMLNRRIDLLRLQKFCSDHFHTLLNIHFKHVRQFIIEEVNGKSINYDILKQYLKDAPPPKNLYVNFDKLKSALSEFDINHHYNKLGELADLVYYHFSVDLDDELIQIIWSSYIGSFLHSLETKLKKDDDNMLSFIKYDPEKYPGGIVKVKTPLPENPEKRTTLKLFKSGKIDIDGANSREEAEFIYYWLNALFNDNRSLTYTDVLSDEDDGEYSFSAEE